MRRHGLDERVAHEAGDIRIVDGLGSSLLRMDLDLTPTELRVLCALLEKEATTPDQYPLSTTALRAACNQKTSRDPVTEFTDAEVETTVVALRERGAVRSLKPSGSRGWKHRHTLDEVLPLTAPEMALLTVLGLRGPQTPGEIRQRTERIHAFDSVEEVDASLQDLLNRPDPLAKNLGREPGQSQDRWTHCLDSAAQTSEQGRQRVMAAEFAALHESGFFALPNPWDLFSARAMEAAGARAVATSSSALATVLGKQDYEIERAELIDHVTLLTANLNIPVHVDGERLFPEEQGGIAETVRLLANAGAAGVSIEDYDSTSDAIIDLPSARAAVAEAAQACEQNHMLLTARCESHLYANPLLDDTVERLSTYADAGAGCVYAPGLTSVEDIERIVQDVNAPVNVLALANAPDNEMLELIGVRRASTGSRLFQTVQNAMVDATTAFLRNHAP